MNDQKPWFYIMIFLVFSSGISGGILIDKAFLTPRPVMPIYSGYDAAFSQQYGPENPDQAKPRDIKPGADTPRDMDKNLKEHFLRALTEELSLTEEQRKQLSQSFDDIEPEILTMRKDMDKKMTAIHNKMNERINRVLTDEQKKRFKEMDARMQQNRKRGGPPPEYRGGRFGPGPGGHDDIRESNPPLRPEIKND